MDYFHYIDGQDSVERFDSSCNHDLFGQYNQALHFVDPSVSNQIESFQKGVLKFHRMHTQSGRILVDMGGEELGRMNDVIVSAQQYWRQSQFDGQSSYPRGKSSRHHSLLALDFLQCLSKHCPGSLQTQSGSRFCGDLKPFAWIVD